MKTTPPGHPVVDSTLRAILRIAELWGLILMCLLTAHAQPWNRTNLTLWLKADAGITLDGKNGVSRWADQSSRSNHLEQIDADRRPTVLTNTLNGLPTLQFRDDWLTRGNVLGTNLFSSNSVSLFVVQRQLGSDTRTTTLAWRGGSEQRLYLHATYDDNLSFQVGNPSAGGNVTTLQPPGWDDAWHVISCHRNGTNGVIRVDGIAVTPPSVFTVEANANQSADFIVGSDHFGNTFNGDIAEILIFNEVLSVTDRQTVEETLLNKWAVARAPAALPDLLIKAASDTAATGDGIYQLQPASDQIRQESVAALRSTAFTVTVQNDGSVAGPILLRASESTTPGWRTTYWHGTTNITADLVGSTGFSTAVLAAGSQIEIRIEITMAGVVPPGTEKTVTLKAYDFYLPALVRDVVQAVATATAGVQADLTVRRDRDPAPAGDGLYNTTGLGQSKWQDVTTNQSAIYHVTLGNDGNTNAPFSVQGTAGEDPWEVRYFGQWLVFDGVDDAVDVGAWSPGIRWTVEAWVNPSATPVARRSIAGGANEARDWGIVLQEGQFGIVTKPADGGVSVTYLSKVPIVTNTWYHVAGSCDGTNAILYINGEAKVSGLVLTNYSGTAAGTRIGSESCCGGNSFPGIIREVRIWNRALTQSEIAEDMPTTLLGNEPGLEGYWRMDSGGTFPIWDLGPKKRHGTRMNGLAWVPRDLTDAITGAGWSDPVIGGGAAMELDIVVTPKRLVPGNLSQVVSVVAQSISDPLRSDTVLMTTQARASTSAIPIAAQYTTTSDFERGWMSGLESWSTPDQLQLGGASGVLPYLWVPNDNDHSISKVDTRTGRELARYRTGPASIVGNPSRTTVDLQGNCWVANRNSATVVKVGLLEHGNFEDRNGDGIVQTSRDLNGDGAITGAELLDWGKDECVLHEVLLTPGSEKRYTPGTFRGTYPNNYWNPGPRGMAVDAQGNLWAGTHDSMWYYSIDGETGAILRAIDVSTVNHMAYGAAIDSRGILWSSGYKDSGEQNLLRLDPTDGSFTKTVVDFHSYGIAPDRNDHLFVSGHQESVLTRWNLLTGKQDWKISVGANPRGIAITDDNDVWVVNSGVNSLTRLSNDGILRAVIPVGPTPTGVAVDANGKVWVCGTGDDYLRRIDPATDRVDLATRVAGAHYGYSDMTGTIARNSTVRLGVWSDIHDSRVTNTAWQQVVWHGQDPTGTNLQIRLRSSNDTLRWSGWETAVSGTPLLKTPPGRYLEFEVTLRAVPGSPAPILLDLSATGQAPAATDLALVLNATPSPVLSEYPQTLTVTVTNRGPNWASGVVVTNLLPSNFDIISVAVPGGFYTRSTHQIVCTLDGVAPVGSGVIRLHGCPLSAGAFRLESTVTANESDPDRSNNTAQIDWMAQPVACVAPMAGWVAWWTADGTTNDVIQDHPFIAQGGPTFMAGKTGQAFLFDSNDDRLATAHQDAFNLNRSGFSAVFWMKGGKDQPGQSEALCTLLEKSHGWIDNTGWAFQAYPATGELGFGAGQGGGTGNGFVSANSLVDVLDERWHCIAGTWDGFNLRLYVDGQLQRVTPLLIPANNSRPLNLGFTWGNGGPRRFFRGLLDEVGLLDRALSLTEIERIYSARSGGLCRQSPMILHPFRIEDAVVGNPLEETILAALGTPPYSFKVSAGTLPPGLVLSPQGVLAGRPEVAGRYGFTVRVTDASGGFIDKPYLHFIAACVARPSGLIGYWNADDATDNLSGTHHGSLEYNAGFTAGRVGNAFVLDGTDDAIRLFGSSAGPLRITTNQVTVAAWVNLSATNPPATGYSMIFDKAWDGSPNGYQLAVIQGELEAWIATVDSPKGLGVRFALPRQRWIHVATTYDGMTLRLYQDGIEVASEPLTGNILPNNHEACIGNDNWPGSRAYAFNGLLDELQVYDRALSAAEILSIQSAQGAGFCPWLFADLMIKGGSQPDSAFSGNNEYHPIPNAAQTLEQGVDPLASTAFEVMIENDGPVPRSYTLRSIEDSAQDWTIDYRDSAGADLSGKLRRPEGFTTDILPAGSNRRIRITLSPGLSVPAGGTKSAVIQVTLDSGATTLRDAVRIVGKVHPTYQPDLMIRRDLDDSFAGEGVFNTTGLGQSRRLETSPGQSATYYLQLKNHGNTTNRMRLTASSPGVDWALNVCGARPALRFDGWDDYVSIPNSTNLHSDRGLSVSAWIRTDGYPRQWQNILWKGNTPDCTGGCENREYALWLHSNGHILLSSTPTSRIGAGELILETAAGGIQANRWHHIAAVLNSDDNTMRIYIDGDLKALGGYSTNSIRTTTGPLQIGLNAPGQSPFFGSIQQVSLWGKALPAIDIAQLGIRNPTGSETQLRGYWPLIDGEGLIARDASKNRNHGTLTNGPTWGFAPADDSTCFDLAPFLGAGWTNLVLEPKSSLDFVVQVTPGPHAAAGSSQTITFTAESLTHPDQRDVAASTTTVGNPSTTPQPGTYTSNQDFDLGRLSGVETTSTADQLQLSSQSAALRFLWVPNSEGSISKVDTLSGRELGRYRTGPPAVNSQPSRTTVDLVGNCYVANRYSGTLVKVGLLEQGQGIDRNGDGILQTSRDLNGDGDITGDELLPWGSDECVLWETSLIPGEEGFFTPGTFTGTYRNDWGTPGVRGVAVDVQGNVWVGTLETKKFYYIEGSTGRILRTIDVSSVNHRTYGAVLDRSGILWASSHDRNEALRMDPASGEFRVLPLGHFSYGIGMDRNGHVFVSGWESSRLSRIDIATATIEWNVPTDTQARGIAVTDDGDVWVAHSSPGIIVRRSNSGAFKASIPVGNQPTGVAVDSRGMVWSVGVGEPSIRRIDPSRNVVDLIKLIRCDNREGYHYGYSDMTGNMVRNSTTRIGFWTVIHDSKVAGTPWGTVSWEGQEPVGTSIQIRVRSSNDQQTWSLWESARKGASLRATPLGRYLEVQVTLQSQQPGLTPLFQSLTVVPAREVQYGTLHYSQDFSQTIGPEWSNQHTALTPQGNRRFLGEFGNQTVTLTLTNLPPHGAATVVFDQFVIRNWEGSESEDGPDLWEVNLAGGLRLVRGTFNNGGSEAAPTQSFPGTYPIDQFPPRSGGSESNTLGFTLLGGAVRDSVYRHVQVFPHTTSSMVLNFMGSGLSENPTEESWGIDDVKVYLVPETGSLEITRVALTPQGLHLEIMAASGWSYVIEGSPNLKDWNPLRTTTAQEVLTEHLDPEALGLPTRFYRIRRLP